MRYALIALVAAACWTGADPPPATPIAEAPRRAGRPLDLEVTLERTACFGACPAYSVMINGDGRVDGAMDTSANVVEDPKHRGRTSRTQLAQLDHAIDAAHFFDLDDDGHAVLPVCTRRGNTVSCSLSTFTRCTDTSHAILTVRRGTRIHRVDDAHCSDEVTSLVELEDLIDRLARTSAWLVR